MGCGTMKLALTSLILPILILGLVGCLRVDYDYAGYIDSVKEDINYVGQSMAYELDEPKLSMLNINHEIFEHSVLFPRPYQIEGRVVAGVVPHHLTASTMISGFFSQLNKYSDYYDTVIILAPNHMGGLGDFVLSYRDWDVEEGVFSDKDFIKSLMSEERFNAVIDHENIEKDHSASVLIPYINYYLPETEVATVLLNSGLGFDSLVDFSQWLYSWVESSEKNILLVCSIDFSHFLTMREAIKNDKITAEAILNREYHKIMSFNDNYLDSPAAINIFLMYLEKYELWPQIIDNTDATEFLGPGLDETTSYMVIVGTTDL